MLVSKGWFFCCLLKGTECFCPHLIEMRAQPGNTGGVQLIEAPRTGFAVEDEACVLEHLEMLRYSGAGNGKGAREIVDGDGPGGQLLKDGHAGGITEGIEPGF